MQRVEKLIFAQADQTPDAVAVEHNGAALTYRQLKTQALEISAELKRSGLKPGQTAAIFQHRSLATLPLMLAIWEAGGIVVPINPTTPATLLESMNQDSSPRIIITDTDIKPGDAENVKKVNLTLFDEAGGESAQLTSREGDFSNNTQAMIARGNVVLVTRGANPRTIETEELHYDPNTKRIWSTRPTVMRSADGILRGTGFESDDQFQNVRVTNATSEGGGMRIQF